MEPSETPGPLAHEVAERILAAIFGPDLIGCQVTPDVIAPIVQEALDAQTNREKAVNALLVQVIEKIHAIATPPERAEIKDPSHLASMLGQRADGIYHITTETLNAWRKLIAGQ